MARHLIERARQREQALALLGVVRRNRCERPRALHIRSARGMRPAITGRHNAEQRDLDQGDDRFSLAVTPWSTREHDIVKRFARGILNEPSPAFIRSLHLKARANVLDEVAQPPLMRACDEGLIRRAIIEIPRIETARDRPTDDAEP